MSVELATHSTEPEVELILLTEQVLSPKQMRLELIDFLVSSPPPQPLHWVSYKEYIVERFNSYYPDSVLKYVFHLIDRTLTKNQLLSAVIDLDSDDEEGSAAHTRSNDEGRENRNSSCNVLPQPVSESVIIDDSCDENVEDVEDNIFSNTPLDSSSFSKEELEDFKKDPKVRHYSRLFKDIYGILKGIKDTTTCRICAKLNYRIVKFQDVVSKESEVLKKAVQPEQETANASSSGRRDRRASPAKIRRSQNLRTEFLTAKEVEKIRQVILMDKLLDLSYPDVLASAGNILDQSTTPSDVGKTTPRPRSAKSSKKLQNSEAVLPDSTGVAEPSKERGNTESVPPDSTGMPFFDTGKRSKKRRNSEQVAPDSTGVDELSKKRGNSESIPPDFTDTSKRSKKRRNSEQVAPDSTETARRTKKKRNAKQVAPNYSENTSDDNEDEYVPDVSSEPARGMVKGKKPRSRTKRNKLDDTEYVLDYDEYENVSDVSSEPARGMAKKKNRHPREKRNKLHDTENEKWQQEGMAKKKKKTNK